MEMEMTMEMYRETDKTMYVLVSLMLKVKNFLFDFFLFKIETIKVFSQNETERN
jgi:hypothetical protein